MTLYDLTKKYGTGKGEDMMWRTMRIVSDYIDSFMDEESTHYLMRAIYGAMSSGHYDKDYALEDVSKMYYTDADGRKHYAPYWSEEQVKDVYEPVRRAIPAEYNFWDFYVSLNMMKADNCPLLQNWFPNETDSEREKKVIGLAVNYLNDPDNPFGSEKVWRYLNSKR